MTWDKTIGTSQDYTTVQSWIDNIPDVDSGSKQMVYGRMTDEDFNESSLEIIVGNWTPDSNNYIILKPKDTTAFDGKPGQGPYIYGSAAYTSVLKISAAYTKVFNIEFFASSTNSYYAIQGSGNYSLLVGNIVKSVKTAISLGNNVYAVNNLVIDSLVGIHMLNYAVNAKAYNNTVHNCTTGIYAAAANGSGHKINNNVVFDCTTDLNYLSARVSEISHNASDDGSGDNPISPSGGDWANEFNDYTNDDFSIKNTGNIFEASELTNADDSDIPINDIIGTARNTGVGEQTSIGCFEYLAQSGLLPIDFITMTDSISLKIGLNKSDSVSLSDSLSKSIRLNKDDSISLSDTILKSIGLNKADTINMSDNFNALITLILELNDSISMSDSISKTINLNKSDAMALSDEIIKSLGLTQSDTINLSDIISKSISINKSDTINLSDNFSALITLILNLSDTINLSDSISKEINLVESDTINMSDEVIKSFGLTRSDIINMADNFSTSSDIIHALLNFVAKNRNFNFNAKNRIFNFNAKSRGST